MRIFVQTCDRPAIECLPFYEVYESMIETWPAAISYFHGICRHDFPKSKRILIVLDRKDFNFRNPAPIPEASL